MDRPTSQTTMELCHACVAFVLGGGGTINPPALCVGVYILHLLLLKRTMAQNMFVPSSMGPFGMPQDMERLSIIR